MLQLLEEKRGVRTADRILLVDDDERIVRVLREALELEGFVVEDIRDGDLMRSYVKSHDVQLVILDTALPGWSGITLLRELREFKNMPVIIVSGRASDVDRIVGLEVGADDYIVKPFSVREVVARVRAVLRRTQGSRANAEAGVRRDPDRLQIGDLHVDCMTRRITGLNGDIRMLTTAELELLEYLYENGGRVCSRDEITAALKGHEWSPLDRSLDTLVTRLRRKIEKDVNAPVHLITVRGGGYRLNIKPRI